MFSEDDLFPISALQHLAFCERQCALIHLEGVWQENKLTAEGRAMHDRAHESEVEVRPGIRLVRGLRLRSLRLGLTGQADVVEFHAANEAGNSTQLTGASGWWWPYPVEYKRGKPKSNRCDEIQLCAQAICLEEMLHVSIAEGALYYGKPRRRTGVDFTLGLRQETERLAVRLRDMMASGRTPPAVREPKCKQCSLIDVCLPGSTDGSSSVSQYIRRAAEHALREPEG